MSDMDAALIEEATALRSEAARFRAFNPTPNAPAAAETCALAAERLADVIEYAETVTEQAVRVTFDGTRHADPRLIEVLRLARGETNERESNA